MCIRDSLLGWLFLPFYIRSGAFTMPEFLEKRFDSKSRWFLSLFSLIAYVLTKVSVTIYAGGIVVSELLAIPFWYGAIGVVVFTGIYTIIGGMKAVIYTETLQAIVLILGSIIITFFSARLNKSKRDGVKQISMLFFIIKWHFYNFSF